MRISHSVPQVLNRRKSFDQNSESIDSHRTLRAGRRYKIIVNRLAHVQKKHNQNRTGLRFAALFTVRMVLVNVTEYPGITAMDIR